MTKPIQLTHDKSPLYVMNFLLPIKAAVKEGPLITVQELIIKSQKKETARIKITKAGVEEGFFFNNGTAVNNKIIM